MATVITANTNSTFITQNEPYRLCLEFSEIPFKSGLFIILKNATVTQITKELITMNSEQGLIRAVQTTSLNEELKELSLEFKV